MKDLNNSLELIGKTFEATGKRSAGYRHIERDDAENKKWGSVLRTIEETRTDKEKGQRGKTASIQCYIEGEIGGNAGNIKSRRSGRLLSNIQQVPKPPEATSKPEAPSSDDDIEQPRCADDSATHRYTSIDSDDAMDVDEEPVVQTSDPARAPTTEIWEADTFNGGEGDEAMTSPTDSQRSTDGFPDVHDSMDPENVGITPDDHEDGASETNPHESKRRRQEFAESLRTVSFHDPTPPRSLELPYQEIRNMNDLADKVFRSRSRASEAISDSNRLSKPIPHPPMPPCEDSSAKIFHLKVYKDRLHVFGRYISERQHPVVSFKPMTLETGKLDREDVKLLQRRCGPYLLVAEKSKREIVVHESLEILFHLLREQSTNSMILINRSVDEIRQLCQSFFEGLKDGDQPCIIIVHSKSEGEVDEGSKGKERFAFLYSQLGNRLYPSVVLSLLKPKNLQDRCPPSLPPGSVVFTTTGLGFLNANSEFMRAFFYPNIQVLDAVFCSILHNNEAEVEESLWFVGQRKKPRTPVSVEKISINELVARYSRDLAEYGYSPYLFDNTLKHMMTSWPHHKVSLEYSYDNILGGHIEAMFDDPLSNKTTKALILGVEIERCRPRTLETLTKEPSRESIWLENQKFFLVRSPSCSKKMVKTVGRSDRVKIMPHGGDTWFNERYIISQWRNFQLSLRPGDVVCVILRVKTKIRTLDGSNEIVVDNGHTSVGVGNLLQIFSSHHWVNLVFIAQHASDVVSRYSTLLPDRTCLLTAVSSTWLSLDSSSFLYICLRKIIHTQAEETTNITWSLDEQVWNLKIDETFEERTKWLILDDSRHAKVYSTLRATICSYELKVIVETYKTLFGNECRDRGRFEGSDRAREPISNPFQTKTPAGFAFPIAPAALALAFQVIETRDV